MGPPVIPSILKQQQPAPKQVPTPPPPNNPNPATKSADQRFDISLSSDDEEGDNMASVRAPKKTPSKSMR